MTKQNTNLNQKKGGTNMTLEQKLSNIRKITAIHQTQYRLRLQNRQHTTEYQRLEKEITRLEKEIGE